MEKLVATFDVELPSSLLINRPEGDELCYQVRLDDCDVEVRLVADESWRSRAAGKIDYTFGVREARVLVSRDEHEEPLVATTPAGGRDYTVQSEYFQQRLPVYQEAAVAVLNRLIRFFKYRLHAPLLHELDTHDQNFQNPTWTDEVGREVGRGPMLMIVEAMPGFGSLSFGAEEFTPAHDQDLQAALDDPLTPRLHDELLSDAQAAALQDNLRRAVLEMAIACEVAVKHVFFAKSTPAGAVFDFLEDKGQIEVSVVELVHKVAREAFGESFKETNEQDYRNIENLFRCRNKVVHKGELRYRDTAGRWCGVDRAVLLGWWMSVKALVSWLDARSLA